MKSEVNEVDKSTLVMRLERYQKDVDQLKCQLNSYTCEPRTHSLFERFESLKSGLETLSATNLEIIQNLKEKKKAVDSYMESAKEQFAKFHQLQQNVEEYVIGARNC
jgi:cell fate (sporulation/competence/biofilm development) regulator YlbF (YheA/YmcA/DUF963 family)